MVTPPSFAQIGVILFAVADIIFVFIGGMASERYGRRAMVIVANLIFLVIVYPPSFYVKTAAAFLAFMFLYGVAHGTGYAPPWIYDFRDIPNQREVLRELHGLPVRQRVCRGPSVLCLALPSAIAYPLYPVYAVVFSLIAIASAVKFRETKDISLMESS